ncbi:hypothetical protein IFM89_036846 [Coptis chinensis]|uniref:Myosin motor domain-containing protein n=1 Tax=Coptis chinensis TaxID=261450 RepID=A0A835HZA2_9MAGN|nr:hypothetical protein IFM89_036846 [Coptis chinensis]
MNKKSNAKVNRQRSLCVEVVVLEDEKVDMGFISHFFCRDPATVKLNRHLIGNVLSSSSSLTWKSLLSFFASRGFPTGSTDNDHIIVHGMLCNSRTKRATFGVLSPHVFAVEDASYSGESGAGKTKTTKLLMQYLTYIGGRAASDDRTVEQQVLEVRV